MLLQPVDGTARQSLANLQNDLALRLKERGTLSEKAQQLSAASNRLGRVETRLADLEILLKRELIEYLEAIRERFPLPAAQKLLNEADRINSIWSNVRFSAKVSLWLRCTTLWPAVSKVRRALREAPGLPELPKTPFPGRLRKLAQSGVQLHQVVEYVAKRAEVAELAEETHLLGPLAPLVSDMKTYSRRIEALAKEALILDLDARTGLSPEVDRQDLAGLKSAIKTLLSKSAGAESLASARSVIAQRASGVLRSFPCWTVTSLSLRSRIPLVPGLFDLAVIDEASQSDIPSAIPVLFRARRLGVVGDPFQLNYSTKLSPNRDALLLEQSGLTSPDEKRFSFTGSSLYDLVAMTRGVEPILLSETYRSDGEIVAYSNDLFYGGRLRAATDPSRLLAPNGMRRGIHWTEVRGEFSSDRGGGCWNEAEADRISTLVRGLLEEGFRGSLGVVTPFRKQAELITRRLACDAELYKRFRDAGGHVDTAHGFQGDERDVIFFSLCGGAAMPPGSMAFLRNTGNLFNVAVSRARAVINIIGDQSWAVHCDIPHVKRLAQPNMLAGKRTQRGNSAWAPHDSPWEKYLYDALRKEGIETIPQYPVLGRRLDLALVRDGDRPVSIDIEVDGFHHRAEDGSRKTDDLWRDIQLQALGWRVMRFWTFELRDDLAKCVQNIKEAWLA